MTEVSQKTEGVRGRDRPAQCTKPQRRRPYPTRTAKRKTPRDERNSSARKQKWKLATIEGVSYRFRFKKRKHELKKIDFFCDLGSAVAWKTRYKQKKSQQPLWDQPKIPIPSLTCSNHHRESYAAYEATPDSPGCR